jgi:hypothetical protein
VTQKAKRMWGDRYERPEGTGKAPMEPEAAFMQVISDMLASQRTISQSLAQVAERLAMVDIPGTQAPHAAQGNSGAGSRPQTPTRTYTSSIRIPRPWFPSFQRAPAAAAQQSLAHRLPTQAEDFAEYKREYAALGPDFHHDMTLVEYCGLRGMDHPREPQRGGQQQQQGNNIDFSRKVGKLTIPSFDGSSKCTDRAGVQKLDMYYKINQMIETEGSDSCAFEGQSDGQDDSACPSSSPSGNAEDSTLQHTGDTCEDSYVLALRHDEIRRLDDLPMGVDMASRKSCMEYDERPMMSEPHFSSSQSYMLATTHEDISGIPDMVEEPCVGIVHKGHMDLQTQEERYVLEIVDLTHTYQYEESESPLLDIPLMDQVVETDSLLGHLLPGSIYSDDDTLLIGRDDHSTCLDTSVWDPGADDISRVSAHEDIAAHTGYSVIQMGVAIGDGVQWPTGGLSSIVDSGQFSALSFEECVVEDSIVDTSSEEHEVEPQRDCDQGSRHWTRQLRVSEDMIMAATRCIDDTHALVAGYCWRASMAHDSSDRGLTIDDFHTLMERVTDQQFMELSTIVPDSWSLGDYSQWVLVDDLLVQSWGLTKAYDTFQSHSWVQIFMITLLDTFIIDNRIGGARQWQGTWRVGRLRPPDRSVLIAYNRIGVDHQGQTIEFLGVMESILGHGTEDNSKVATYSDSHWDEGGQISTVTNRAHQQLLGVGSDELPNLIWDPRVHWVDSLFHLMRIHAWRVQYGYFEQTVMIRVEQHQYDGPCQRLAWDPGITGLVISLTDGDERMFAGGSHFVFPLSFSIGESTSLVGDSLRSCSTSLWQQHVQSVGAMLSLVWSDRIDPFQVEAMCYLQETHGVDMLQNYTPQGIAVHILIWDPGIGVLGSSMFDGVEFQVEWLLGELTKILWPLIILLIMLSPISRDN